MYQSVVSFDKKVFQNDSLARKGKGETNYLGDYAISGGNEENVITVKKDVGPCSIVHFKSERSISFNRSWHHIRDDATEVVILWFIKRGGLRIFHAGNTSTPEAGDFVITKSTNQFAIECRVDENSQYEAMHIMVPAHLFRKFIPGEVSSGFFVQASGPAFALIDQVMSGIFSSQTEFTEKTQRLMLDGALSALSDTIQKHQGLTPQKESVSEKRLKTALDYIDLHLSDPKLNNARVAKACGISPRYLSFLLKKQGLTFADYVKEKRLASARRWLSSSNASDITIAEIAFRVGFKSPAHFSRIFKQAYDKGPREYRSECQASRHQSEDYSSMAHALAS